LLGCAPPFLPHCEPKKIKIKLNVHLPSLGERVARHRRWLGSTSAFPLHCDQKKKKYPKTLKKHKLNVPLHPHCEPHTGISQKIIINKKKLNVQLLSLAAKGKRDLTIEVKNRPGRTKCLQKRPITRGKETYYRGKKDLI
jgi:hypothetical protein